jgi:Tfp pilus assembly protein PilX
VRQRGAVLFVGLVFLVVLTALGLTAIRVSTQQERMTGNFRDRSLASESAESAMREAERKIGDEALALMFNDDLATNPSSLASNAGLIGPLCEAGDPRRWQEGSTADCALCAPGQTKTTSIDTGYTCPDSGACWICGSFNWSKHAMQHGANATYGTTLKYVGTQDLPQAARYVIEELKVRVKCSDDISLDARRGAECVMPVRRITTRGTGIAGGGGSDTAATVVLQETYFPTR